MLNKKMIGIFKIQDPDDLLENPTYGFIVYDAIDPDNSILWASNIKNPPVCDWDKLPVLKEAIYQDVYVANDDGEDSEYREMCFDVTFKLLSQNALCFSKFTYEEYMELQDLARRGRMKNLEQMFSRLKEPLKAKYMRDNGYEEEE